MDWFRMYGEFATDAKVQIMPEAMQRRLVMLLCLRCSNDLETLQDEEIAYALRIDAAALAETKALFVRKNFIDENWRLKNWDKRQFRSDSSTARVAKFREKQRKQAETSSEQQETAVDSPATSDETACNVSVTPQIQIQIQKQNVNPLGASAPNQQADFALSSPPAPVEAQPKQNPVDADFERAWAIYPKRHGGNPKKDALAAWRARRAAGVEADVMIAGLERYRVHLANDGKLGTQFVMQAATFFGPGERYLEDWAARAPAGRRLTVAGQDHSGTQRAMEQSLARLKRPPEGDINFG